MERRTLLLGSGVAFTTALAGCTDLMSGDGDDGSDDGNGDDSKSGDYQDIPGLADLELDSEHLTLTYAKYDDSDAEIGVRIEKDPDDIVDDGFREHTEELAHAMDEAIDDKGAFTANVESITFALHDENDVLIVKTYLKVKWLLTHADDEMTMEELLEKMHGKRK